MIGRWEGEGRYGVGGEECDMQSILVTENGKSRIIFTMSDECGERF